MLRLKRNPYVSQKDNDKEYHDYAQKAGARLLLLLATTLAASGCAAAILISFKECRGLMLAGLVVPAGIAFLIFTFISLALVNAFASAALVWGEYDLGGRQEKVAQAIALAALAAPLFLSIWIMDVESFVKPISDAVSNCR